VAEVIKWTRRGLQAYNAQLEFRAQSYTDRELNELQDLVDEQLAQLLKYPERGLKSKQMKTVGRVTVQKTLQIYYRVVGRVLIIVYFADSRQSPDVNPYL
jgi:plasmid stabilization system protein ParE